MPGACDASWPEASSAFEDQVVVLVNQRRAAGATCGTTAIGAKTPLVMNAELRRAARCHSQDMATQNYFSHTSLDGRSPWDRIDDAGYTGFGSSENIAAGYASPEAVVAGWMSSPGHCANIMSNANELGVGHATGGSHGSYWTQTFGVR